MKTITINGETLEIKRTSEGHPYATTKRRKHISIVETNIKGVFSVTRNFKMWLGYYTGGDNLTHTDKYVPS